MSPRKADGRVDNPAYRRWVSMRQRCFDENLAGYKNYGGRGITVAPEWDDFWKFLRDVGPMPTDGQRWTLDRIDNDGNYEPGNVRWATYSEQNRNRRKYVRKVPEVCRNGHQYVPVIDQSGARRCSTCLWRKNHRLPLKETA